MKKFKSLILLILIIFALPTFSACDFGSKRITDINEYGKFESYIELPEFFPNSVSDYTINSYAYNLESWMDTCYEIFLDVTVTESQFFTLLGSLLNNGKQCYYASGFYEVVFQDSYEVYNDEFNNVQVVGYADIEKIVYNPTTFQIVFVAFHANDTGVYPLNDFAYFNRFNIDENEYASYLTSNN